MNKNLSPYDYQIINKFNSSAERVKVVKFIINSHKYNDIIQTIILLGLGVWIVSVILLTVKNRRADEKVFEDHLRRLVSPIAFSLVPPLLASLGECSALSILSKGGSYEKAINTIYVYGVYGPTVMMLLSIVVIAIVISKRSLNVNLPFMPKLELPFSRASAIIAWTSVLLTSILTILYTIELFS